MWMWVVVIAWMYVAVMMAVAEATSPVGTVLGALITFALYGVAPMCLALYLIGTPARRRAQRQREVKQASGRQDASAGELSAPPDRSPPPVDP